MMGYVKFALAAGALILILGLVYALKKSYETIGEYRLSTSVLQQQVKEANEESESLRKNYSDLQNLVDQNFKALQKSLLAHSEAIQRVEQAQGITMARLNQLKAQSNEDDRKILEHPLPQFRCLYDGSCEDEGR